MSINLTVPQTMQELRPRITVIGVGGAGCNAVNNMINADLDGVDFLVANTDGQALAHSLAPRKIQLGTNLTAGLGAGSKPDIGRQAAEESMNEVLAELSDCNMVFITAGMGGGTGTGAAPVIAKAARERGILTVGVVTKPFEFEGPRRMKQATTGIEQLAAHVDTLIVVPNQNLFHVTNERTTFADAFHMADTVLHQGVSGVTDLMLKPGIINLDFADIRSVMTEMGKAMMGTGEASGEHRAITAAETAINNPLLEDTSLRGAKALIVNVTGGPELGFFEVDEAVQRIRQEVDEDANLIFGSAIDDTLDGTIRVSVVATGIDALALTQPAPSSRPTMATQTPQAAQSGMGFASSDLAMPEVSPQASLDDKGDDIGADTLSDDSNGDTAPTAETQPETSQDIPASSPFASTDMPDDLADGASYGLAENNSDDASGAALATEPQEAQLDIEQAVQELSADDVIASPAKADDASKTQTGFFGDGAAEEKDEKAGFIPQAPLAITPDPVLEEASPVPNSRPSLIHKISGLWASRAPETAPEAKEAEPEIMVTKSSEDAPKILDLPRTDALQETLPIGNQPATDESDDELDIPAFLRRQAN
ncbi:MAG: cell division protein FtsZ [Candidatus Puniceispirillaceae bacterium]